MSNSSSSSSSSSPLDLTSLSSTFTNDDEPSDLSSPNGLSSREAQVGRLLAAIQSHPSPWAIGDHLGSVYHFIGRRLFQHNSQSQSASSGRLEVTDVEHFLSHLKGTLLDHHQSTTTNSPSFLTVELAAGAQAKVFTCHRLVLQLTPPLKLHLLLLGPVALVQGSHYYAENEVSLDGSVRSLRLYGRTFEIRVSSQCHAVVYRTEDIIRNWIRWKVASEVEPTLEDEEDEQEEVTISSAEAEEESLEEFEDDERSPNSDQERRVLRSELRPGTPRYVHLDKFDPKETAQTAALLRKMRETVVIKRLANANFAVLVAKEPLQQQQRRRRRRLQEEGDHS